METGQKGQFWAQNDRFLNFLKNRSLLFSETFHDIKVLSGLQTDRVIDLGKILVSMETRQKGQFWAQNDRFPNFLINRSFLFTETFHDIKVL